MTSDNYVECDECGHPIEVHDRAGCHSTGSECTCRAGWTVAEIRRARREAGLPARYHLYDIGG